MSTHGIQHIAELITQLKEDALISLREQNKQYDFLRSEQVELSQMELDAMEGLPDHIQELFNSIAELRIKIGIMEYEHLYVQGYKDCINILKLLDIL